MTVLYEALKANFDYSIRPAADTKLLVLHGTTGKKNGATERTWTDTCLVEDAGRAAMYKSTEEATRQRDGGCQGHQAAKENKKLLILDEKVGKACH